MKLIICCLILLAVATAAPLDSDHKMAKSESASAEVQIPAYIRKIYKKMSQAMEQDDLHMSLKYLRTVQTVHWLEPLSHGKAVMIYIVTICISYKLCQDCV